MKCFFPVIGPLTFVQEAVKQLDYKLNVRQTKNLILVLSTMILCGTMSLTVISFSILGKLSTSALSHFFSYAGLDGQKLMKSAVRWAIRTMSLISMSVRLAVDDTMKHHSKGCRKIKGVYWLFDHVLQSYCNAKCIVFVYLVVNERIRFPIGWRTYKKNGPSKWELAIEIIDDVISYGLKISVVLFDSWFCVSGFIKQLEKRKLNFIGDIKSSNIAEYIREDSGKKLRLKLSEVFSYGKVLLKKVLLGLKSNKNKHPEKVLYETYRTIAYLSAFKGKYVIVKSIDQRTGASKIFVCNNFSWEAQKILEEYSYRWMIEEFFGNAKGLCAFEGACIRSEQGGALALFLVSFVDLLVLYNFGKVSTTTLKGNY